MPQIVETGIRDLLLITGIEVLGDERGSFSTPFRNDFDHLLLKNFRLAQMNRSENVFGVTRGIHAEPWNKYITVAEGLIQSVIVDLRQKERTFAEHRTFQLDKESALFVPKGCGNSFQTLSENAIVIYITNRLWQEGVSYPAVSLFDESLGIEWLIPKDQWIVSLKDKKAPMLSEVYKN